MNQEIRIETPVGRGPRWHYLLVGAMAAAILFWNLGAAKLDDHECKMAVSARVMADPNPQPWMILSDQPYDIPEFTPFNHWMVPIENGQPRLVKTPLPYWIDACIARAWGAMTGQEPIVNESVARSYAAGSALLLALVTLALGRRMFTPRAALLGAIMLVTCVGFQKWGRNARPEMLLCLLMTSAMVCFYLGLHAASGRGRTLWMIAFWVLMGLGNLAKEFVPVLLAWPLIAYVLWRQSAKDSDDAKALHLLRVFLVATFFGMALTVLVTSFVQFDSDKGPYAVMALSFGLPMLWYLFRSKGWRGIVPLLPTAIPGIIVMFAMFVPWMVYMTNLFPRIAAETFSHQVTERAAGVGGWGMSGLQTYLVSILNFPLPWLAFLPGAFAVALMKRFASRRAPLVFLLLWVVGLFALFMSAAGKREHYLLPTLPAIALLMGFIAEDVFFNHVWITSRQGKAIGIAYGVIGVLAVPGLAFCRWVSDNAGRWIGAAVEPSLLPLNLKGLHKFIWSIHIQGELWQYMVVVSAIAAVPFAIAGILALRNRLAPQMGLMVAGMVIIYVGHWAFVQHYDRLTPVAQFAQAFAAENPPPDAKLWPPHGAQIYHWGDPQDKTVFYSGRFIPAVQWDFMRDRPKGQKLDDNPQWQAWIGDRRNAPWIISYMDKAPLLANYGYEPVFARATTMEIQTGFALFHRQPMAESRINNEKN